MNSTLSICLEFIKRLNRKGWRHTTTLYVNERNDITRKVPGPKTSIIYKCYSMHWWYFKSHATHEVKIKQGLQFGCFVTVLLAYIIGFELRMLTDHRSACRRSRSLSASRPHLVSRRASLAPPCCRTLGAPPPLDHLTVYTIRSAFISWIHT